jgi:hypothetical protein
MGIRSVLYAQNHQSNYCYYHVFMIFVSIVLFQPMRNKIKVENNILLYISYILDICMWDMSLKNKIRLNNNSTDLKFRSFEYESM